MTGTTNKSPITYQTWTAFIILKIYDSIIRNGYVTTYTLNQPRYYLHIFLFAPEKQQLCAIEHQQKNQNWMQVTKSKLWYYCHRVTNLFSPNILTRESKPNSSSFDSLWPCEGPSVVLEASSDCDGILIFLQKTNIKFFFFQYSATQNATNCDGCKTNSQIDEHIS